MKFWLTICLALGATLAGATPLPEDRQVREAFHFAFPISEMMRVRQDQEALARANGRTIVNRLVHRTALTTATERGVTAPNNDTLYSGGWLDLSAGPILVHMPALTTRYHSLALLDLFTDHQLILGTRTTGGRGGRYLIAGPNWRGDTPAGATLMRVAVNDLWLVVRVLVDGPADLPAALQAQAAFRIEPITPTPSRVVKSLAGDNPRSLLALVNEALGRGPLPAAHADRVSRFAAAGIRPDQTDSWDRLTPAMQVAWTSNYARLRAELKTGWTSVGTTRQQWVYPKPGIGEFGADDLYRARVALSGLHALPAVEAMYLVSDRDVGGAELDGRNIYRLRLPDVIPVNGFWSISMYKPDGDGRWFFLENPLGRYAIGNRTIGVVKNRAGTIELIFSNLPPKGGTSNWLPAPDGPFRLMFRAYLPGSALLDGRFLLPAVERVQSQ